MLCKICGREINDNASFCPYCGHKTNFVQTVFCTNCGKPINSQADICPHCLHSTQKGKAKTNATNNMKNTYGESKTAVGVFLCLFLGIIGLIIGLVLYPANTVERETFLKGWVSTLVVTIVVAVILVVAVTCVAMRTGYSRYY